MYVERADITMNLMIEAKIQEQTGAQDLSLLGDSYINPGKGNWQQGDYFQLELITLENSPKSNVTWLFDGRKVFGAIILEGGYHVLEAVIEYSSGVKETIRKEFNVQ